MTVDIELLLGLVDLLHNDITDRRHIQLADGIKALAAENGRLKGLLHRVWWIDYQRDDCGGDGPEEKHTCFVGLCETHRKEIEVALGVEGNELPKV